MFVKALELAAMTVLALCLNIAGAVVTKFLAINISRPALFLVLAVFLGLIYLGRFIFWLAAGRKYKLSFFYPFLSINYVIAYFLGIILFGEPINNGRLFAALVIVAGVAILATSGDKYEFI